MAQRSGTTQTTSEMRKHRLRLGVAVGMSVLSGVFFAAAMPNFDISYFAWVALVPLLLAIDSIPGVNLRLVTLPFGLILSIACHPWYPAVFGPALGYPLVVGVGLWYAALLAWGLSLRRGLGVGSVLGLLAVPLVWSALEFLKLIAPIVEDWWFVPLATSQWRFPPALQVLSITGFPGLSFMLLLSNVALATLV